MKMRETEYKKDTDNQAPSAEPLSTVVRTLDPTSSVAAAAEPIYVREVDAKRAFQARRRLGI
jgi:hypothetical protein